MVSRKIEDGNSVVAPCHPMKKRGLNWKSEVLKVYFEQVYLIYIYTYITSVCLQFINSACEWIYNFLYSIPLQTITPVSLGFVCVWSLMNR